MRYSWTVEFPEKIRRRGKTDHNNDRANKRAVRAMRYHSTHVPAKEAPNRHWCAIFPVHITLQYEHEDGHPSHAKGQKVFEGDHMPDIAPRDKTQRADHEDANPGSKIAAIQCATRKMPAIAAGHSAIVMLGCTLRYHPRRVEPESAAAR